MNQIVTLLVLILVAGCSVQEKPKDAVAKVDSYVITQSEFEEQYKDSSYGAQNTAVSRRDFLNNMINQKLILLDAQKMGLDKDREFLKMVESFWQQSLLTTALKKKTKEGGNLDQWVESLKQNAKIEINEELLK